MPPRTLRRSPKRVHLSGDMGKVRPNSALSTDAFSSLRCGYGAAKRGR
jgi:hypothetical protein